jgi:hypothetical protein
MGEERDAGRDRNRIRRQRGVGEHYWFDHPSLHTNRFPRSLKRGGTFGSMSCPRQRQAPSVESSRPDANKPLMKWPMAHGQSERSTVPRTGAEQTAPRRRQEPDDIAQLAGALRAAKQAHRRYVAELCQADVEPAEDWSTWYAEYLLGQR